MEYYSVFKRMEILTHTTTRMNLENTVLSVVRQSPVHIYYMRCVTPTTVRFTETEVERQLPGAGEEGGGEFVGSGFGVSAGKIETLCVGDSCEQCEYTLCH
jgi:hypothetical protein